MERIERMNLLNLVVADRLKEIETGYPPRLWPDCLVEDSRLLERTQALGLHVIHNAAGEIELHTDLKPLFLCASARAALELLDGLADSLRGI
jgi:hypothetical protein